MPLTRYRTAGLRGLLLVLECWLTLLCVHLVMAFGSSTYLRRMTADRKQRRSAGALTIKEIVHAIDLASIFYIKRVLCLQYSVATAMLLNQYGWDARLITGAQIFPYEFHAWCEVDGAVVNDKPYMREVYFVFQPVARHAI